MKMMMEQQKEELAKKRERVLSACGIRQNQNICTSPIIQMKVLNQKSP